MFSFLKNKSPRRKKKYWKKSETDLLKEAVNEYGKKWSTIQKIYPIFKENGRTQIDLKDKWRNLTTRSKGSRSKGSRSRTKKTLKINKYYYDTDEDEDDDEDDDIPLKEIIRKSRKSKKNKKIDYGEYELPKYTIYTIKGCSFCTSAKNLLKRNKISFKEVIVTKDNKELIYKNIDKKTNNYRYFPIIFKKNIFIGGFKDLDKNNL